MSLSIGIVGLPNAGKSTLFNALTKQQVLAANYPFATINPNVGVVPVPDPRLPGLARIYPAARVVPASVSFVDIAGLVRGAHAGHGLGNRFLAHIRESAAIIQVVRAFANPDVSHVDQTVDPKRDIDTINTELMLADLATLERRLPAMEAEAKTGQPESHQRLKLLQAAKTKLDQGQLPETAGLGGFQLLTAKPIIYVFNVDEARLTNQTMAKQLTQLVSPSLALLVCAKLEADLAEASDEERTALLHEVGLSRSGLEQVITAGYQALSLQTMLTAGPKEVRAWTIRAGSTAPEAAGVIHTDFAKGFIKAEIVSYDDLMAAGSLATARANGKVRLEGRDYVMQEGDVVEFRFNT